MVSLDLLNSGNGAECLADVTLTVRAHHAQYGNGDGIHGWYDRDDELLAAQAQGIAHDKETAQTHGRCCHGWAELLAEQRIIEPRSQRNHKDVVEKCPEEVLAYGADDSAAELQR